MIFGTADGGDFGLGAVVVDVGGRGGVAVLSSLRTVTYVSFSLVYFISHFIFPFSFIVTYF